MLVTGRNSLGFKNKSELIKMASNTIILEATRSSAKQFESRHDGISIYDTEQEDDFNSRWTNFLDYGITLEPGDRVSVEGVMVNTKGSGDDFIEFNGPTDKEIGGVKIVDNKANVTLGYYVSNRYQFAFPLPKENHVINYARYTFNFGGPDFTGQSIAVGPTDVEQHEGFIQCYPYNGIEGAYHDDAQPRTYTMISDTTKRSIIKDLPPCERYYIGGEEFSGPYFRPTEQNTPWTFYTRDIELRLPEGFSTPSAVGEKLTSQLHSRQGKAIDFDTETFEPRLYRMQGGVLESETTQGISDESYVSFPTASGQLLRNRSIGGDRQWDAGFQDETKGIGVGYTPESGNYNFWSYMCSANPFQFKAFSNLNQHLQSRIAVSADLTPASENNGFYLWTGNTTKASYNGFNMGELAGASCINSATMKSGSGSITYWDGATSFTNPTAKIIDITFNDVIPTNMLFNQANIDKLKETSYSGECDVVVRDEGREISFKDTASLSSIDIVWKLGRSDDETTFPTLGQYEKLTNQYLLDLGATDPLWAASIGTGAGKSYSLLLKRDPSNPAGNVIRPALYGSTSNRSQYDFYCYKYLPSGWNAKRAMRGDLPIPNLNLGEFQMYPPNRDLAYLETLYSYLTDSDGLNIGLIPVFYKDGSEPDANLKNVPFIAPIYSGQNTFNIPYPLRGEPFAPGSPSIMDNFLAKMVTTQKTGSFYTQWDPGFPTVGINPYDYVPYIYAGAANSQITFDDTTTRFGFQSLHTSLKQSNGVFQDTTDPATSNPDQDILTSQYNLSALSGVSPTGETTYNELLATAYEFDFGPKIYADSHSGVGILQYKTLDTRGEPYNIENYAKRIYDSTLFSKLGFNLEQLLPYFGSSDAKFNRGNYNRYLGLTHNPYDKYNNMVRPLTTNSYISGSEQNALIIGWGEDSNSDVIPVPMYNLGGTVFQQSETNAVSDTCYAEALPSKLDYSYLVLRSDLFRGSQGWYGSENGKQKLPAMAYVTRNYSSGDYFYAFATQWEYIVDNEYTVSDITTEITLPDGRKARLGTDSSVIYKIVKPKVMPPSTMIAPAREKDSSSDHARKQSK